MTDEPLLIEVDPASELARALAQAETTKVMLEHDGVAYRLVRDDDPYAGYDPARVQAALDGAFGLLKGADTESLKRELREQRAQDSAGRPA